MAKRIVVEWTRATVRVAVAETRGKECRLTSIRHQPLGSSAGAADVLRTMLGTASVRAETIIGVVPREQVMTRTVKLPSTRREELAQMVEMYAKVELPYAREQTILDFHVLHQQGGFSTVGIVACQRDVIERSIAVLREAGLPPALLTISAWGVLGWSHAAKLPNGPILVINVDDTRTDFVLIAQGRILSSRSIGQGAQDWGTPNDTVELLATEIERSRAAARKELPEFEVRSIVLTGVGQLTAWAEALAQQLDLPMSAVEGAQAFGQNMVAGPTMISPVVVGGLACSPPGALLNLSPPDVKAQSHHRRQVRDMAIVGALIFGVLVLGVGLLGVQIAREQQVASRVDQALSQVEPKAKRIQDALRVSRLVASVLDHRRRLATVLSGVLSVTPASVSLDVVTFERSKREVVVRGNASSTQDVLDYVKQLEAVEGVGSVRLKYSTRRSSPSGERTDFEVVLEERKA